MELPQTYSYNPQLRLTMTVSLIGAAALLLPLVMGIKLRLFTLLGAFLLAMGLLIAVRGRYLRRHLVLEQNTILVPTGFLRLKATRIPYEQIERLWEVVLPFRTVILCLRADGRTFEIHAQFLRNKDTYFSIRDFLVSRASAKAPATTGA